ncbi:MAG: hypothetical protein RJQ07_11650 [Pseudomonadales bacterium]
MVKIIGNIQAADDYTHELGPEENFNESVYFNFFDPEQNRGGFMRIGNRANEGYAEMTVIVWNPDGSAFFMYNKPAITHNDGWDAGGLKVEVIKPAEVVRTTFTGEALFLSDPTEMRDPGRAFKNNPRKPLEIDLTHTAVGPFYGHIGEPGDGNNLRNSTCVCTVISNWGMNRLCSWPVGVYATTPGGRATGRLHALIVGSPVISATTWEWWSPPMAMVKAAAYCKKATN